MPILTEVTSAITKSVSTQLTEMYRISNEIRDCEAMLNANKIHLFRMLPINTEEKISWAKYGRNGGYRFIYFNRELNMERPVSDLPLEPRVRLYADVVKLVGTLKGLS